jgi:hypothetical protein
MSRAALENARRFAPGPVVEQAERLITEAVSARRAGRPVVRKRRSTHLAARGFAARDTALVAASGALRIVRKGRP